MVRSGPARSSCTSYASKAESTWPPSRLDNVELARNRISAYESLAHGVPA